MEKVKKDRYQSKTQTKNTYDDCHMNSKTQKQIQKERSHEHILETASRLFRQQGYKATGIDQVMAESNLTAGAFYAHFKNKEDLLKEVLTFSVRETRKKLTQGLEEKSPREKLAAILGRYCSRLHRDHPEEGCVLPAIASELHRTETQVGPLLGEYLEKWILMTSELLQQINKEDDLDQRTKAINLISQSVGSVLLSRVLGDSKLSDEVLKAARTPQLY